MNLPIYYLTITYTDSQNRRATRDVSIHAESYADAIRRAADLTQETAPLGLLSIANQNEGTRLKELRAALVEAQETLLHNRIDTGHLPGISQRIRQALKETE